jgi:minor histocompatibility antigen H13
MAQSAEAIRAYASLLVQATIPLVLGSFKSLKVSCPQRDVADEQTPESTKRLRAARLRAKQAIPDPDEDEAYDDENSMDEVLTWGDTLIIPLFGSVALLGMWLIIKYAGKEWINFVLGIYCMSS